MTALEWDAVAERRFETGVDHGVLYLPDNDGNYDDEVAPWNGLVSVTETPGGAESNPQYADNIKYLDLLSAETFAATIEAFTYPDEFAQCDGTATPAPGVAIGQQGRRVFGLAFRTKVGNALQGADAGHKLHLLYGCQAAPSEKAYTTINDSPEALTFSWDVNTTPVNAGPGLKPTSLIVIDSTKVDPAALAQLEELLFGDEDTDPRLPSPAEVIDLFEGGDNTEVRTVGANAPAYNGATHVVTLPAVTGVIWLVDGEETAAGALPALGVGESVTVEAVADDGYVITSDDDWTFDY